MLLRRAPAFWRGNLRGNAYRNTRGTLPSLVWLHGSEVVASVPSALLLRQNLESLPGNAGPL